MSRGIVLTAIVAWCGATLVLAEMRWFRRPELTDRIARYTPGVTRRGRRPGALSAGSFRDVIAPLASSAGERLSRLVGVTEELEIRLVRIHAPTDVAAFRLRELGVCLGALAGASVLTVLVRPPATIALLFLLGAPALAFLVLENQIARASARWQRRIFAELPIVTEQLGHAARSRLLARQRAESTGPSGVGRVRHGPRPGVRPHPPGAQRDGRAERVGRAWLASMRSIAWWPCSR